MKTISVRLVTLAVSSLAACGSSPEVDEDELGSSTQPLLVTSWQASLPATWSQLTPVEWLYVQGCVFTIGHATDTSELPPPYYVWIERLPEAGSPSWCTLGYVTLAKSYSTPSLDIVAPAGRPALVADYSFTATPSGSAYVHLGIEHLAPRSGATLHYSELAALPPSGTGMVSTGALSLKGGNLTVTGDKYGVIPGETGSGSHYTAYFAHFLSDQDSTPAPTWVQAY